VDILHILESFNMLCKFNYLISESKVEFHIAEYLVACEFATRFQLIVLTGVMKFAFRAIIRASNQLNVFSLSRLAFVNIIYVEIRTVIIEYIWDKHTKTQSTLLYK